MGRSNPPFMTGVPELLVLRLLADREMYGYELLRTIRLASGDAIALAEGVVYPLLHGLEAKGLLDAREQRVAGRQRVYYRLSTRGRRRLRELSEEWERVQIGVAKLMEDPNVAGV